MVRKKSFTESFKGLRLNLTGFIYSLFSFILVGFFMVVFLILSRNGWQQLVCRINQFLLKVGMTASAFFKEIQYCKQKLEVGPAAQKIMFSLRIFSIKQTADLVTFTEETLNGKLPFSCSAPEILTVRSNCIAVSTPLK